jgi:hypothetical protein
MLQKADARLIVQLSGMPPAALAGKRMAGPAWYLERLHRQIGEMGVFANRGGLTVQVANQPVVPKDGGELFPADFYLDDRVRESFALLAFFREEKPTEQRLRFRKSQDLGKIKDPTKIRVIEAERTISRQDMSLLTLALNPANDPKAIRAAWEQTLAVTARHLALSPLDRPQQEYLFAPHYPYLLEDDLGFTFSPEMVEDLPNADQWGGRNDILLSSYLHFRNLPDKLPEWLLRAAKARSDLELKIVRKFEEQTFLPMILECDNDAREIPEALFRAKWSFRKPFGEDIFPGTLLLLRLGYLDITPEGSVIRTAKFAGA